METTAEVVGNGADCLSLNTGEVLPSMSAMISVSSLSFSIVGYLYDISVSSAPLLWVLKEPIDWTDSSVNLRDLRGVCIVIILLVIVGRVSSVSFGTVFYNFKVASLILFSLVSSFRIMSS